MADETPLEGALTGAVSFETAPLMRRIARSEEIDVQGHVNNAVYLTWMQEIATAHWRAVVSPELAARFTWVVLRHEIDYRGELLEGDRVDVRTWLGRASGPRFERYTDIRKEGGARPSAEALSTWCLIDIDRRKPARVGGEIFEPFGVSPSPIPR